MAKETFYVTTTIPYANASPHIGFALEIVQADVLARWKTINGYDTFFLTGTDEHGTKNYQTAKKEGLSPKKFVDKNSKSFKKLTKELNISNDYFIRTTDEKVHWPGVREMWKRLEASGDIYKKEYTGTYCQGCERFITKKELQDGKCPNHPNLEIEETSEENYFFRLSKYSEKIKQLIKEDKLKISPEKWKKDFLGLIEEGLKDVSFSRDKSKLPWGIPVPGDENQVMYVWCDALTNYLTGIGFPDEKYKNYWPADVHVAGKDMLRFHTGIWPGMLLSAGLPLPKEVIVHGFLTVGGRKMSKSLGNVIDPLELTEKYPADSIRYTLMRATPFGEDGDFSISGLTERHNNELADKLGNLVSRTAGLISKNGMEKTKNTILESLNLEKIKSDFDNLEIDKALAEIFSFIDKCNEYIQEKKPWETKDKKILYELADSIKTIAILLWPFIPSTSERIAENFGFSVGPDTLEEIKKPLEPKKLLAKDILFKKFKPNEEKEKQNENLNKPSKPEKIMEGIGKVSFGDWEKIDLRVAEVKNVEEIEGADKLWKVTLDVGEIGERTVCAGIKKHYSKEGLLGKKVVYFSNLEPKKLKGIESQGMILAASNSDQSKVILLKPEEDIESGAKVS